MQNVNQDSNILVETKSVKTSTPSYPKERGYIPHVHYAGQFQFITFRLYDCLPKNLLNQWREELGISEMRQVTYFEEAWRKFQTRIENYQDQGHGECFLRRDDIATVVENALSFFDQKRYRLLSWCIMPNHVHVLIETFPKHTLASIVQSWKSFTAKSANKILNRTGSFWASEYFDRYMRNDAQLKLTVEYIENNPIKAGLCSVAEEWKYGSASRQRESPAPDSGP